MPLIYFEGIAAKCQERSLGRNAPILCKFEKNTTVLASGKGIRCERWRDVLREQYVVVVKAITLIVTC